MVLPRWWRPIPTRASERPVGDRDGQDEPPAGGPTAITAGGELGRAACGSESRIASRELDRIGDSHCAESDGVEQACGCEPARLT